MIHGLFTTGSCVGTSRAIVNVAELLEVGRRTCRNSGTNGGEVTATCEHKSFDPNSTTIVFQCIKCQFATACFVLQAASPRSFAWRQSFDCPGLHHSTCSVDPSIGPNRESKGPRRRLEGCKRHPPRSLIELCQEGHSAPSHISFVLCLATANKRCILAAYGTSHINRSSSAGTSTPEADSTASLIHLTCHLTTFLELSAAPLDRWPPSAVVSCTTSSVKANFTAMSNARMEGSLSHRNNSILSQIVPDHEQKNIHNLRSPGIK